MALILFLTLYRLVLLSGNPSIDLFPLSINSSLILWAEGYESHIKGICLLNNVSNSISHLSQGLRLVCVYR